MTTKEVPKLKCAFCEWTITLGFGVYRKGGLRKRESGHYRLNEHIRDDHPKEYRELQKKFEELYGSLEEWELEQATNDLYLLREKD